MTLMLRDPFADAAPLRQAMDRLWGPVVPPARAPQFCRRRTGAPLDLSPGVGGQWVMAPASTKLPTNTMLPSCGPPGLVRPASPDAEEGPVTGGCPRNAG